jgi:hypothetical protein
VPNWWWKADIVETCSCGPFACPCNYTSIPTHGYCYSVAAYEIKEGAYGDTRLDGLRVGMFYSWPNPIHEGNGRALVYIDELADEAQRDALAKIGKGEAGEGGPFEIFASTYAKPAEAVSGPIEFERDGNRARFRLGDAGSAQVEPFRSAMDDSEADVHWVLPTGFIWRDGNIVRTVGATAKVGEIEFSYDDAWGVISEVEYNVSQ